MWQFYIYIHFLLNIDHLESIYSPQIFPQIHETIDIYILMSTGPIFALTLALELQLIGLQSDDIIIPV